jgi:hypothetical protein
MQDIESTINSIPQGTSWACTYTVTAWLDAEGKPIQTPRNLQPGEAHPGAPGKYTGVGVLQTRDRDQLLVRLWDPELKTSVVVHYDNTRDWDTVEWRDA